MARREAYDAKWDVAERPLTLEMGMRSADAAEMARDLREFADAIESGDISERLASWRVGNCPHEWSLNMAVTYEMQEAQREHEARLLEAAERFKKARRAG